MALFGQALKSPRVENVQFLSNLSQCFIPLRVNFFSPYNQSELPYQTKKEDEDLRGEED